MGIFNVTPKRESSVVAESPQQKITREMAKEGHILSLYAKDGRFLTDHLGNNGEGVGVQTISAGFYVAMNLNFVQNFGNVLKIGLYDPTGVNLVSPRQASIKLLHQFGEDAVVHTNSKVNGHKVSLSDYDGGVLVTLLKLPKDWDLPQEGQLKVKLQSTMIFNPLEMETFMLRVHF